MYAPLGEVDLDRLNSVYAELEQTARSLLARDNVSAENVLLSRTAQMRYVGQTYEIETPIPDGALTDDALASIADTFHAVHKQEHGVSSDIFDPALVSLSVAATAPTAALPPYRSVATEKRGGHEEFALGIFFRRMARLSDLQRPDSPAGDRASGADDSGISGFGGRAAARRAGNG